MLGKAEGQQGDWHGHITALTVAPQYRKLGLAKAMVEFLERMSDDIYKGFFLDLFVRCNNHLAIRMYENMGYSVFRRIRTYYGRLGGIGAPGRDEEDAFGECRSAPAVSPITDTVLYFRRYAEASDKGPGPQIGAAERARHGGQRG